MELKQIKKNIWYILTIIGTSCGVIGGWFTCAVKGYETGDWFLFWSGVVTVVGMVFGLGIWTANLIIEIKNYRQEKKLHTGIWLMPKIKMTSEAEKQFWELTHGNQKEKGVVKNGTERNPKDTRPQ